MSLHGADKFVVVGYPIAHSLSPFIMNRAFRSMEIEAVYAPLLIDPGYISNVVSILREMNVRGANVTFPYKQEVAEQVDIMSPVVDVLGASNTLTFEPGSVRADNTDAPGTCVALTLLGGIEVSGSTVLILGAGGSARAAAYGLLDAGASTVTLTTRDTTIHAEALRRLHDRFGENAVELIEIDDDRLTRSLLDSDIVINATPMGMEEVGPPQDLGLLFRPGQCVFDFVYHPRKTALLERAKQCGAKTIEGLALLVSQASLSFEIWTGRSFDVRDMFEAVIEHVMEKQ